MTRPRPPTRWIGEIDPILPEREHDQRDRARKWTVGIAMTRAAQDTPLPRGSGRHPRHAIASPGPSHVPAGGISAILGSNDVGSRNAL